MSIDILSKPLVSICCLTYNHENYIRQCLDGFVMQKTTFPFEILVHEDASTDNTANIVKEYEAQYPHLFRCVYQTENQFAKQNTFINILFPMSRGKYIALCEGDDYWTDPYKLQKQIDILEKNDKFSFCFHNALVVNHLTKSEYLFVKASYKRKIFTIKDLLLKNWFIPTASLVWRREYLPEKLPEWFFNVYCGDLAMELMLATKGDFFYLEDIMSVYRLLTPNSISANPLSPYFNIERKIILFNKFKSYTDNIPIFYLYVGLLKTYKQLIKAKIVVNYPQVLKLKETIKKALYFRAQKH